MIFSQYKFREYEVFDKIASSKKYSLCTVMRKGTNNTYIAKIIDKDELSKTEKEFLRNELKF